MTQITTARALARIKTEPNREQFWFVAGIILGALMATVGVILGFLLLQ